MVFVLSEEAVHGLVNPLARVWSQPVGAHIVKILASQLENMSAGIDNMPQADALFTAVLIAVGYTGIGEAALHGVHLEAVVGVVEGGRLSFAPGFIEVDGYHG